MNKIIKKKKKLFSFFRKKKRESSWVTTVFNSRKASDSKSYNANVYKACKKCNLKYSIGKSRSKVC